MKIAIVGSGVSGLVTAWLLHREHEITLFEKDSRLGGHVHTVTARKDAETQHVDTGFIVFNDEHYPRFSRLLQELGVASQPSSMSFGVCCDRLGIEYAGAGWGRLFAQRRNLLSPRHWNMLRMILRFHRLAPEVLRQDDEETTVEAWVQARGLNERFLTHYLVPLGASLWSCPAGRFRRFPMRFVADFLHNHGMLQVAGRPQWRVVQGGSSRYVEALIRPFAERLRTGSPVERVQRHDTHVELRVAGETQRFDEVVFACHADQALALLADPSEKESAMLRSFPYQRNTTLLHTDTRVLPRRRRAWASWNYRIPRAESADVHVTYRMNELQSLRSAHEWLVTLNDPDTIRDDEVIERLVYEHPSITTPGRRWQPRHAEFVRARRTSFCGAYWGFGFHEDGVRSADAVAAAFGAGLPA